MSEGKEVCFCCSQGEITEADVLNLFESQEEFTCLYCSVSYEVWNCQFLIAGANQKKFYSEKDFLRGD